MTRDEILKMEAGREMDYLVEEHVFGAVRAEWLGNITFEYDDFTYINSHEVPPHSGNIASAWNVFEKIRGNFFSSQVMVWDHSNHYAVCLSPRRGHNEPDNDIVAYAPTAPLAICRAALIAVVS